MKICCIGTGTSVHIKTKLNYLESQGLEVHLISPHLSDGFNKNVHLHQLKWLFPQIKRFSRYLSAFLWPYQVKRLLKEIRPDVLDGDSIIVNGYLAALSDFHPFILTVRGSDLLIVPEESFFQRQFVRYALRKSDLIICNSDTVRVKLKKHGIDSPKVVLIRHGVDTDLFNPQKSDASLKRDLNADDDNYLVISIRHLLPFYNVELLVRAIPKILKEVPSTLFIIAGNGVLREYLQDLTRSLGVAAHVRFVGSIPFEDVGTYLASSDVYVSTSLTDSCPKSLQEAMACGTVPVVTDISANREWVQDGKNGFLISTDDDDALALKVIFLLEHEEARKRFAKNCTEQIAHITPAWEMERMIKAFDDARRSDPHLNEGY